MREKRAELTANMDHVQQTLEDGARRAREVAVKSWLEPNSRAG